MVVVVVRVVLVTSGCQQLLGLRTTSEQTTDVVCLTVGLVAVLADHEDAVVKNVGVVNRTGGGGNQSVTVDRVGNCLTDLDVTDSGVTRTDVVVSRGTHVEVEVLELVTLLDLLRNVSGVGLSLDRRGNRSRFEDVVVTSLKTSNTVVVATEVLEHNGVQLASGTPPTRVLHKGVVVVVAVEAAQLVRTTRKDVVQCGFVIVVTGVEASHANLVGRKKTEEALPLWVRLAGLEGHGHGLTVGAKSRIAVGR